jgi:hypothetical protein
MNSPVPASKKSRPQTIANLNAEARRLNAVIKKEANAEKARQEKRAKTLASRKATIEKHRFSIGGLVRKKYLTGNRANAIAMLVAKHGNLTPANLQAASIAFASPAFARASRNKQNFLKEKVAKYRSLWRGWITGLTPNQRKNVSKNVYKAVSGNKNLSLLANHNTIENPLLFGGRALAKLPKYPNEPEYTSNLDLEKYRKAYAAHQKKVNEYRHRWTGARTALMTLANPEVNAILRRYGLPFSMTNARRNLLNTKGQTAKELNRTLMYGRGNLRHLRERNKPMSYAVTVSRGFPVKARRA